MPSSDECSYGVVLQRSPKPLQVVGHQYETWVGGRSVEMYRVEVSEDAYQSAVQRVKRVSGLSDRQRAQMMYEIFKPG